MKLFICLIGICSLHFFIGSLQAKEILSTSDFHLIEEAAEELDSDSLVLFDVDGTLIMPDDAILKPKGRGLFGQLIRESHDRDLFREIRLQASHSVVDERTPSFVLQLQKRNVPTLAFTAACAKIQVMEQPADWRIEELNRYGFNFHSSPWSPSLQELPRTGDSFHVPMFKSGVLFSSFHPKGEILVAFLQMGNWKPKKVLFIDDELEHVESVVSSLEKEGISCLGVHYTAVHEASCELRDEQAIFQIQYFLEHGIWLGDQEIEQRYSSAKKI